jgi:hypothetical protein
MPISLQFVRQKREIDKTAGIGKADMMKKIHNRRLRKTSKLPTSHFLNTTLG